MARTKASSRSFVAMVAVIALLGLVLIGSPSAWVSGSGKSQGTPEDETRLSTFRTATMKGAELPSSHSSLLHEESDQISGAALTAAMVAAVLGFLVAVPGAMAAIGGPKVNVPAQVSTMPPKEMLVSATPAQEMMVPATPPSDTVSSSPPKDMFEVAGSEVGQVAGMSPAQMAERRAAWQRLEPAEVNYIREDEME